MSFSTHPFYDMTIGLSGQGLYCWSCDSCGGQSSAFLPSTTLETLHQDFIRHVRRSHRLSPEDVANWSRLID